MKIVAFGFAVVVILLWLGLQLLKAESTNVLAVQSGERGPVTEDIDDSDLFFQSAIRAKAPERDNSQKIDALLKRMTLEEKVGQMTQLTINMITSGQDQNIQIDPAKLDKAIVHYGVG